MGALAKVVGECRSRDLGSNEAAGALLIADEMGGDWPMFMGLLASLAEVEGVTGWRGIAAEKSGLSR